MNCKHHDEEGDVLPDTWMETDGRGIPIGRVCDRCVESVRSRFRPEILNRWYSEGDVDEDIEGDNWVAEDRMPESFASARECAIDEQAAMDQPEGWC